MELHHPIMSKLRNLGDQTYRQTPREVGVDSEEGTTEGLNGLIFKYE